MKFQNKNGIEVFFDNGIKIGTLKHDRIWNCWRVEFEDVRLSKEYVLELYKFMKKLK